MERVKEFIKKHKLIIILVVVSIILHSLATVYLGVDYNINSDDISYINSGINFKNNHIVSMHNEFPSAQIMPGMTYIIALISLIFKEGTAFWCALKIIWAIFGILSIIGLYKIVTLLLENSKCKEICAFIASIPLLLPSFLWMDNLILTETPFMCGLIYIMYFSLKEAKTHEKKNFLIITFLYLFCTLLKANFAIFPLLLILYLIFKKYDIKLLIKEFLLAGAICSLFFVPWIIRNYNLFGEFIPLTYGGGNPLLLGTYQGYNYPSDEEIKTSEHLNSVEEIQNYLNGETPENLQKYYSLKTDGIKAKYRMQKWWELDKKSMIISYMILKPKELLGVFYWDELFGIKNYILQIIRVIELAIFLMAFIYILIKKKLSIDLIFIFSNALVQVAIYSYTFTFTRYGQTLIFVIFIGIGYGLNILLESIEKKEKLRHVTAK